ncbi:MAG: PilZ domain-containing protein [Acidimicrobiales bacterium]|jgi:hypothetical protein|nr:PilZ domain-containing protein [Acidimicrobiales bacterium]
MNFGSKHTGRLLPRHETAGDIIVTWNVHTARAGLFKKEERSETAALRDLSLEGALVEVVDGAPFEVGDVVPVRFRGLDGNAIVRHVHTEGDASFYGVNFSPEQEFSSAIDAAVGELRSHSAELLAAWHRQN